MVAWRKAILFGFLIWILAFATAFLIFPIRESSRPLFESIMPVVLSAATVAFANRYFRGVQSGFVREGILLGLVWLVMNVGIDLPFMLSPSPMQMSLSEYMGDIGLTYVLIPVITGGMGWALVQRQRGA